MRSNRITSAPSCAKVMPANGTATSVDEAVTIAESIGYPVLVRPSYVLGGRAMEIVHDASPYGPVIPGRATRIGALRRPGAGSGANRNPATCNYAEA